MSVKQLLKLFSQVGPWRFFLIQGSQVSTESLVCPELAVLQAAHAKRDPRAPWGQGFRVAYSAPCCWDVLTYPRCSWIHCWMNEWIKHFSSAFVKLSPVFHWLLVSIQRYGSMAHRAHIYPPNGYFLPIKEIPIKCLLKLHRQITLFMIQTNVPIFQICSSCSVPFHSLPGTKMVTLAP